MLRKLQIFITAVTLPVVMSVFICWVMQVMLCCCNLYCVLLTGDSPNGQAIACCRSNETNKTIIVFSQQSVHRIYAHSVLHVYVYIHAVQQAMQST